jgi:hypothetical protein
MKRITIGASVDKAEGGASLEDRLDVDDRRAVDRL